MHGNESVWTARSPPVTQRPADRQQSHHLPLGGGIVHYREDKTRQDKSFFISTMSVTQSVTYVRFEGNWSES